MSANEALALTTGSIEALALLPAETLASVLDAAELFW